METIFSVPTSQSMRDGGIPRATPADDCPIGMSGHMTPSLTLSGTLQSVVKQDPMSVNMSTLLSSHTTSYSTSTAVSHGTHLLHFTDDFDLPSMKPIGGSPLLDDEDDDMRSLLAAAAAVAASVSPASPHLRSSSSGLNTPPDTRVCPPLDLEIDGAMKTPMERSEHGLHTAGGAALLVSRLNSTAAALAKEEDPLGLKMTTSVTSPTSNNTDVDFSSAISASSPSSRFFNTLTSERRLISNARKSPLLTNSIETSIKFPSPNHDTFICTSAFDCKTSSPSTLSTPPQQPLPKQNFVAFDVSLQTQLHSPVMTVSTTSPSFPSDTQHYSEPNFSSCSSLSVCSAPAISATSFPTPWLSTTSSNLMCPPVFSCAGTSRNENESLSIEGLNQNLPILTSAPHFPGNNSFPVTSATLSSPSSTPPSESSSLNTTLVTSETTLPNTFSSVSLANTTAVRTPPDTALYEPPSLPTLTGPSGLPSFPSDCKVSCISSADCPFTGMDSGLKLTSVASNSEHEQSTCDHSPRKATPNVSPAAETGPLQIHTPHTPDSQLNFFNNQVLPSALESNSHELDFLKEDPSKPDDTDLDVLIATAQEPSPIPIEAVNNIDHLDDSTTCDEAEYISAAVAAVEDVVYALAGNRKPDPSLEVDPALEGTGTDRILTLSLAPAHSSSFLSHSMFETNLNGNSSMPHNNLSTQHSKESSESISMNGLEDAPGSQMDSSAVPGATTYNPEQLETRVEFPCSSCSRVFSQKALLLKHRIMHDEPKHTCDTCGRCFVREDKLKRHVMSIHTTEKPHVCTICTKAFSRKDKLKDHLKHHERAARNFECQQCQQPFVQKSDLNRHIRGVHQGEPGVGINMGTKRRAPGLVATKLNNKKKSKLTIVTAGNGNSSPSSTDQKNFISVKLEDGLSFQSPACQLRKTSIEDGASPSNSLAMSTNSVTASIAAVAAAAGLNAFPTVPTAHTSRPVFVTGAAPGLMLPTMTLTQAAAQHHLVQQQQAAAAAAAAVMLPGGAMATLAQATHPSAFTLHQHQHQALQQQQQQFFAMAAVPANLTQASTNVQMQQQRQQATATAVQQQLQLQPELKAVATPNGPMMVWTRIAAANQASHPLAGQAVFPQMVGFHPQQQQQLQQQLQQQQQMVAAQQQQLLQQHHANYAAAAAAAAAAGTQLIAVSGHQQAVGTGQTGVANLQATPAHQFQLHQQQLQQQQVAALAARQQAAHNLLFPAGATATGTAPTSFFCNPADGVPAGLILASSTDPASFALAAAAQAQAAAAAAAAQQQASVSNGSVLPASSTNALSASAFAAATGLQVVAGYSDAQHAAMHQQQQQLMLQQHYQQRLAVVASAASAAQTNGISNSTSVTALTSTNSSNGAVDNNTSVSTQDGQPLPQTNTQLAMAHPDSAVAMNSCYQLAAALYQHHHPGFMLAATNNGTHASLAGTGSTMAAVALHQQQQQYQQHQAQQQASLMAAYQQHQQQQHALQQQQHNQLLQQQQQRQSL